MISASVRITTAPEVVFPYFTDPQLMITSIRTRRARRPAGRDVRRRRRRSRPRHLRHGRAPVYASCSPGGSPGTPRCRPGAAPWRLCSSLTATTRSSTSPTATSPRTANPPTARGGSAALLCSPPSATDRRRPRHGPRKGASPSPRGLLSEVGSDGVFELTQRTRRGAARHHSTSCRVRARRSPRGRGSPTAGVTPYRVAPKSFHQSAYSTHSSSVVGGI